MKEFYAKKGGRYLALEDVENLQELSLAWGEIFKKFGNFVARGCVPTYNTSSNTTTITSGYVFLDGKMCVFSGGTLQGRSGFIKMTSSTQNAVYADGTSNQVRTTYAATTAASVGALEKYVAYVGTEDEESGEIVFSYPTFETQVIGSDVVRLASNPNAFVELTSKLRVINSILFRQNGEENDSATIQTSGEDMFIGAGFDPDAGGNMPGLWIQGNMAGLTAGYGDMEVYEGDSEFWSKKLRCAQIIPRVYDNRSTFPGTDDVVTDGSVNVGGTLKVNGLEVPTKGWVGNNEYRVFAYGDAGNPEGFYAHVVLGCIGPVVSITGYFISDDYDRDSNTEVEFTDLSAVFSSNAYKPAYSVQFPVSIHRSDQQSHGGYTGYIRISEAGRVFMSINTHNTEEETFYWKNLRVYISGAYVPKSMTLPSQTISGSETVHPGSPS